MAMGILELSYSSKCFSKCRTIPKSKDNFKD
jgi:hypothetical protein